VQAVGGNTSLTSPVAAHDLHNLGLYILMTIHKIAHDGKPIGTIIFPTPTALLKVHSVCPYSQPRIVEFDGVRGNIPTAIRCPRLADSRMTPLKLFIGIAL
jgi:hypothetical protein